MPTQVQDVEFHSAASGTSHVITVASTGSANLLVLVIGTTTGGAPATTVSGITGGGTWVNKVVDSPATHRCGAEIWFIKSSTSGATTVTITLAASASCIARFYEYSGMDTTAPDDAKGNLDGASTAPTATSGTLATAIEIAFGINVWSSTSATISSQTAGWTYETLSTSNNSRASIGFQTTAATTALTIAGTLSASVSWAAAIATFKPAASSGALSGTTSINMDVSGTLLVPVALVSTTSIDLGMSGTLSLPTLFVGTTSINLDMSGTLSGVPFPSLQIVTSTPVISSQASSMPVPSAAPVTQSGANPVTVITSTPAR